MKNPNYDFNVRLSDASSTRAFYGFKSKPTGITIHHWGADGQSHDGVVSYLTRDNGNTSAHLVTSAGRVTRLVDDERAAWHAGSKEGNGSTIGIECRPEMSDEDWNTLVQLCADLEEIHGSLKYYRHSDWKATACPGRYGSRIGELVANVNAEHRRRAANGPLTPKPKPAPVKPSATKSTKTMAAEVIAGRHGTGHANRRRSLGITAAQYELVRAEVNRQAGSGGTTKSVAQMATEVIQGKHGSGHERRRKSLGISAARYALVRAEVNKRA